VQLGTVGGTTVGALGSHLLSDGNPARKKALKAAAVAIASAADQVVLVLGIRSTGYGLFTCARKRRPGHETKACAACNCSHGDLQPWSDPDGPYGDINSVGCPGFGPCAKLPGHLPGLQPGDEYAYGLCVLCVFFALGTEVGLVAEF
jgi:hypothetical protein